MTLEAPLSRYKRNSLMIAIVVLVGFGLWCIYDGYFNQSFIKEHTHEETGEIDSDLVFNRKAPPFLFLGGMLTGAYWFIIRNRKLVATETELILNNKLSIPYDAIQSIDKTYFKDKGYFDIHYKKTDGSETKVRIDDRKFDHLEPILDHLIKQIT